MRADNTMSSPIAYTIKPIMINIEQHAKQPSRATSLEELDCVIDKLFDSEKLALGLTFQPQPEDIVITPYAKCGTTWLQQITHGLRTRGDMDFDEINSVVPWIEIAHDVGWDLSDPQIAKPRLFKSHASAYEIPIGCRYICSFRHPRAVIESHYRFYEGWLFESGAISLEEFLHWRWPRDQVDSRGYWYHLTSWWEQRHNPNVLLLCYEDMLLNPTTTVEKIARFMGIELDDSLLNLVLQQSSRKFMLEHKHKFDERHLQQLAAKRALLPHCLLYTSPSPRDS